MEIAEVSWKQNISTRGIKAVDAYSELEKIRVSQGGITDDAVVSAASSKDSPIHKWFDWDDTVAAREHRRSQAQSLIRSIVIVPVKAPELKTRAYEIQVKSQPKKEPRTIYSTMEEVLSNTESRERLRADAWRTLQQFRNKFHVLEELSNLIEVIDETLESLNKVA